MKRWAPSILLLAGMLLVVLFWSRSLRQSLTEQKPAVVEQPSNDGVSNRAVVVPAGLEEESPNEGGHHAQESEAVLPKPIPAALAAMEEAPPEPEVPGGGPGLPPVTVLENVRTMFRQYCTRFGGNPVGDNAEITAALNGANPRQMILLDPEDGARLNQRGEMVDHWNTAYFFHQLSRTEMEIRSAGPDQMMWTADDLVIR